MLKRQDHKGDPVYEELMEYSLNIRRKFIGEISETFPQIVFADAPK